MHIIIRQAAIFTLMIVSISGAIAAFVYHKQRPLTEVVKVIEQPADPHWSVFYSEVGNAIPVQAAVQVASEARLLKKNRAQYTLEVKVFRTRAEANGFIENLSKQRIDTYFTPVQLTDGRVQYRVRSGLFPSLASAERISHELKSKKINNQVVKLN